MLVIPWKQDISYEGWAIPWKQRQICYYPECGRWQDIPDASEDMMKEITDIVPDSYYNIEKVKKILKKYNGKKGRTRINRNTYRFIVVDGNRCWVGSRTSYQPEKYDINYGLWKPEKLNLVMSGQFGDRVDVVPPRCEMEFVDGRWLYIPKWSMVSSLPSGKECEIRYQFNVSGFDPGRIVTSVSILAYFIKRSGLTKKITISKFELDFTLDTDKGCYDVTGDEEWIWHRNPDYIGKKISIEELGGTTLNTLDELGTFKTDSVSEVYDKRNYFLNSIPYDW